MPYSINIHFILISFYDTNDLYMICTQILHLYSTLGLAAPLRVVIIFPSIPEMLESTSTATVTFYRCCCAITINVDCSSI